MNAWLSGNGFSFLRGFLTGSMDLAQNAGPNPRLPMEPAQVAAPESENPDAASPQNEPGKSDDLLTITLDSKLKGLLGVDSIGVSKPTKSISESNIIETAQGKMNVKSEKTFWLIKKNQPELGATDPLVRLDLASGLREVIGFFYERIKGDDGELISEVFGLKLDNFENSEAIVFSAWSIALGQVKAEALQPTENKYGNQFMGYIQLFPAHAQKSLPVPTQLHSSRLNQETFVLLPLSPISGDFVWVLAEQMPQILDSVKEQQSDSQTAPLKGDLFPKEMSELDRLIDERIALLKARFQILKKHPDFKDYQIVEGEESFGLANPIQVGDLSFDRVRMVGDDAIGFRIDIVSSQSRKAVPILSFKRSNLLVDGLPNGFLRYMVAQKNGRYRLANYAFGSKKAFTDNAHVQFLGDSVIEDFDLPNIPDLDQAAPWAYSVAAAIVKGARLTATPSPVKTPAPKSAKRSEWRVPNAYAWVSATMSADAMKRQIFGDRAARVKDLNVIFYVWDDQVGSKLMIRDILAKDKTKQLVVTGSTMEQFRAFKSELGLDDARMIRHENLAEALRENSTSTDHVVAVRDTNAWQHSSVTDVAMTKAIEQMQGLVLVVGQNAPGNITHQIELSQYLVQLSVDIATRAAMEKSA